MLQYYWLFTFQVLKAIGSTTVGCMISFPGKTPHVTAIGVVRSQFVSSSPYKWEKKNYDLSLFKRKIPF